MIGIFDSGSGGLTVLRAIRERLPSSDVLYFGDIRNAPYGMRPHQEISALTTDAVKFLAERGAGSIVSACNSASATLALSLLDAFSLETDRLIEMVGPTVSAFKGSDVRVILFATKATVEAGIYQSGFKMIGKDVTCVPIPDLAGAIEAGASETDIARIVAQTCAQIDWDSYDVAVLACTHYPLVYDVFRAAIPDRVGIFDPADAVAERVERRFWPREAGDGNLHFVITKDSETFRAHIARMFPDARYQVEVFSPNL
jgi:glutamate racemase